MRNRITVETLYAFDELTDEAKETARNWYRDASAGDDFWSECTLDGIADAGRALGIDFDYKHARRAIWFSGFSSQGDGASYEGTWHASDIEPGKVAAEWTGDDKSGAELRRIAAGLEDIARQYPDSRASVSSGRYHNLSIDCDMGDSDTLPDGGDDPDALADWRDTFPADDLAELLRDFAHWAYRALESEYEYQNSDEQIDESIRCNEYEFTEEGCIS